VSLAISAQAEAQPLPAGEAEAEKRERATLLAQTLPDAIEVRSKSGVVPLLGGLGLGLTGLSLAADWHLSAVGGAVIAGGAAAFYFTPETRNYELLTATTQAGVGLMYLGFDLDEPHQRWQQPIGVAYLSVAALSAINTVYSPHPGRTQLLRDLRRVRTPAGRHGLSQQELHDIETRLYRTDPYVPRWLSGLPLVTGGLLAAMPLFDGDVSRRDKLLTGAMAGSTFLTGFATMFAPSPAESYRDAQRRAGLWLTWTPLPGGVSVLGTFD